MLEGAGFEVIDLGINTDADAFLAALDEHQPDILGMSALLTTTMPYMKVVIETLKEKGLRDEYIVLVGGAPLNEEFGTGHRRRRLLPRRRRGRRDRHAGWCTPAGPRPEPPMGPSRAGAGSWCWPAAPWSGSCADLVAARRARPRRSSTSRPTSTTGPSASRPPSRPASAPSRPRAATTTCCWATPTAAPAAGSTRSAERRGVTRLPGAHCYEFFAGPRRFDRAARRRARHLLPDRLPGPALRRAW